MLLRPLRAISARRPTSRTQLFATRLSRAVARRVALASLHMRSKSCESRLSCTRRRSATSTSDASVRRATAAGMRMASGSSVTSSPPPQSPRWLWHQRRSARLALRRQRSGWTSIFHFSIVWHRWKRDERTRDRFGQPEPEPRPMGYHVDQANAATATLIEDYSESVNHAAMAELCEGAAVWHFHAYQVHIMSTRQCTFWYWYSSTRSSRCAHIASASTARCTTFARIFVSKLTEVVRHRSIRVLSKLS